MIDKMENYIAIKEVDIDGEKTILTTHSSGNKELNKYNIIKIIDTQTNKVIHSYKEYFYGSPLNKFLKINNNIWWIGGRHYMLRLFVNCSTGEVYDDPDNREQSDEYKDGYEFIWAKPFQVSPNGKMLVIDGCVWAGPYETRLYDISNIPNGTPMLDLYTYAINEDEDVDYCLGCDDYLSYNFNENNELEVYYHKKDKDEEKELVNTIRVEHLL
jgi:hypothetical protein